MEFAEKIGDLILDDSYSSCETMNFLLYILLRFAILGSYKLTFSKIQDCRLFVVSMRMLYMGIFG